MKKLTVPKPSILVIDDRNDAYLNARVEQGESDSETYFSASSRAEILRQLLSRRYAVIIIDIKHKAVSLLDILAMIKKSESADETPLMLVSDKLGTNNKDNTLTDLELEELRHLSVDYLKRPVDPYIYQNKMAFYIKLSNEIEKNKLLIERLEFAQKMLKQKNAELNTMASMDALTGLANRRSFDLKLSEMFVLSQEEETRYALLFIDLDNFKSVNDNLGHEVGDKLLIHCAELFRSVLRKNDFIARIGGDEFAVIIRDYDSLDTVKSIAESLCKQFVSPPCIDSHELNVSCSIGIACYPDNAETVNELVQAADEAMYKAKEAGKNTFRAFEDNYHERNQKRVMLTDSLNKAIDNHEIWLAYQLIFELKSQTPRGVEVLSRWNHPAKGNIDPEAFLFKAAEENISEKYTNYVLNQALEEASSWANQENNFICVNLMKECLFKPDRLEKVLSKIRDKGISPSQICLEIQEQWISDRRTDIAGLLEHFKKLGFRIHLDGCYFGEITCSKLASLPISMVKIDKKLIAELGRCNVTTRLVRDLISISKSVNIKTLALGVETEQQLSYLNEIGCDYAQGYLLMPPIKFSEIQ